MTTFNLFVHPSEDGGPVADVVVFAGDGTVDVPAQVHEVAGDLVVTLFTQADGPAWTYPLDQFRAALDRAAEAVRDSG